MVKIPIQLESVILGLMLSDGHLFINKSGNTLLKLKLSIKSFELFWIIFSKFNHYCQGYPRLDYTNLNKIFIVVLFLLLECFPALQSGIIFFILIKLKLFL